MYRVVFAVACVLAFSANVQAEESVEQLGYKIYTLGVQAARAEGATKEAMLKQLASLQERQRKLIEQGGPVEAPPRIDETIPVAPPVGQGPATDWSRGSYGYRGGPQQWGAGPQFGTFHNPSPFVRRGSYGYKIGVPGVPGIPSYWTGMRRFW